MGTWNSSIFGSDVALDIKHDIQNHLSSGNTVSQVKSRILDDWADTLDDPDEQATAWLALALTLWDYGLLEEDIRYKATVYAEKQESSGIWPEKYRRTRALRVREAIDKISTPNLNPRKIRLRTRSLATCPWPIDSILSYRCVDDSVHYLRVCQHHVDDGGVCAIICVLDLGSPTPEIFDSNEIKGVRNLNLPGGSGHMLMIRLNDKVLAKIHFLGVNRFDPIPWRGAIVTRWANLDDILLNQQTKSAQRQN